MGSPVTGPEYTQNGLELAYAGGHPRVRLLHNVPSFILITTAVPGELIYSTGQEENEFLAVLEVEVGFCVPSQLLCQDLVYLFIPKLYYPLEGPCGKQLLALPRRLLPFIPE